jgi:hypothetical protein
MALLYILVEHLLMELLVFLVAMVGVVEVVCKTTVAVEAVARLVILEMAVEVVIVALLKRLVLVAVRVAVGAIQIIVTIAVAVEAV